MGTPVPSRISTLLKARRQFDMIPASKVSPAIEKKWRDKGVYGFYSPTGDQHTRPYGVYFDMMPDTRRHETMHGIFDAASSDPELRSVLPWWARNAKPGGFEDELLARLAAGHLRDWPMSSYFSTDPLKYAMAMPIHAVATHPEGALAGLVGGGAIVAGAALSAKEPQQRIADQFDRQVGR